MKVKIPKGNGILGDMASKMKKMQDDLSEMKNKHFEGSSGGGAVKVEFNGDLVATDIKISNDVLNDVDMLQDLIISAVNNGLQKVISEKEKISSDATNGIDFQGFNGLF